MNNMIKIKNIKRNTIIKINIEDMEPNNILTHTIESNPYRLLYVDITNRCNMNCNFCYNPIRTGIDMNLEYFEEVCKRLSNNVRFRFVGGEPTIHPQLFEFLKVAYKYNHGLTLLTNGIKISDYEYAKALKDLKIPLVIGMSFDGGRNNDDIYEYIENSRCSDMKMQALNNMEKLQFKRVAASAIIVRGVNEFIIPEILEMAEEYKCIRYIHFRSAGKVGNFIDTVPYTTKELRELMLQYMPANELTDKVYIDGKLDDGVNKCHDCCYHFQKNSKIEIGLIEFASEYAQQCWKRGKLNTDFTIQRWFENMVSVDNQIKDK